MSAPPRLLSPFVRTRTRLTLTLGLVLAALTAALLPWWLPDDSSPPQAGRATDAERAATGPRDEAAAMAEARRTRRQVLVDTATTATSQTWARPDGQLRTRISALPQRAKNADGVWAPTDNRLLRTEDPGGLGVRPANPVIPVRFSGGTPGRKDRADRSYARLPLTAESAGQDTVLAELDIDGHTVAYTWPGPLPEPVLDGPRALYPEVLPGVDLLLVAREEGGFAQLLIVKDRQAARNEALATVSYGLRSDTAVFRYDEAGSRVAVLDPAGKELGSVPTPFAWDSAGRDPELPGAGPRTSVATPADVLRLSGLSGIEPGAHQARLPIGLEGDRTGTARIDLKLGGTGLLADEATRFPVFVDPTLNGGWQAWTVAYKPYPNSSFWNGTNFSSGTSDARVGHEDDTGGTARSFWRMQYSSGLKGATVSSATFKVLNNHSWSCTKREFQFWLTGSISSGTTWNKQPKWSTKLDQQSFAHGWSSSSCPDEYESFDVKTAAQQGANGGWTNITFGMRATSENDTQTWRKFRATSATLTVVYNRKPSEPTGGKSSPGGNCAVGPGAGITIGKTTLTLSANAKDPDGNLSKLRFRFWQTGGTVPSGWTVTPDSSGTARWPVPSSIELKDKTTYSWDVRAEDSSGAVSTFFPPGTEPCRLTIDATAPPQPEITSTDFPEATSDGQTWAKVKFGATGSVTFTSAGATRFRYAVDGLDWTPVTANASGEATVTALEPPHAGPNWLNVYAYDVHGNESERSDYAFYVPPRDKADGPWDTGGDGIADLLTLNHNGHLFNCVGGPDGDLHSCMGAAYTSDKKLHPAGHWYDGATGKAALITHFQDAYPGDGATDLFAVTPDGGFWLYPGDGYGSFNVDERLRIRLPSGTPAPSTWTQIRAVGDITGDRHPDLVLRAGPEFWTLSGYSGASFRTATLMNHDAWARRDIVNVADINGDSTPDLLWRNLDNGNMYVRHGKPGAVGGSVDLVSLKLAVNSLNGDVSYGTYWTEANVATAIGIPDVSGDGIPDIWARFASDGYTRIYHPSRTNTNGPVAVALSLDWNGHKGFG
ncbi:DNRLRE domain-containing protein [Streptomyces poriticola]|uniref:DNRLRE domain-containing protein n=1 Tax=Streptomyces poriticola TaxID=3120506 RepID=UPI002FCDE236